MRSKKLIYSIFLLIIFFLFTGAKTTHKKAKKSTSPFEQLKKKYLNYKHTKNILEEEILKKYYLKFESFSKSGNEKESIAAKYYCADVKEKLYETTGNTEYLVDALKIYKNLQTMQNSFGLASRKKIELYRTFNMDNNKSIVESVKSDDKVNASKDIKVKVQSVKQWSYENYTRIVVEMSDVTNYEFKFLKEDLEAKKPKRIFIDIEGASLSTTVPSVITVSDKFVEQVRIGQFSKDILRIVVDLKSFHKYKVSHEKDPFRIIIDIFGEEINNKAKITKVDERGYEKIKEIQENKEIDIKKDINDPKKIQLTVNKIVIDAGHGGHDPGAIGYQGLKEKDVVLDIALKLGKILNENFPQIDVIYTRKEDVYLTLEERTKIANENKADVFISIHANASKNRDARGIETYFLNFAKEERAKDVAGRENAITLKGINEVQIILRDLIVNSKYNESSFLASLIQKNLTKKITLIYNDVLDLGVKQGPFYVLIGAAMPSVLVETSFITHETEGAMLSKDEYRLLVAKGVFEGVKEYIMKTAKISEDDKVRFVAR